MPLLGSTNHLAFCVKKKIDYDLISTRYCKNYLSNFFFLLWVYCVYCVYL